MNGRTGRGFVDLVAAICLLRMTVRVAQRQWPSHVERAVVAVEGGHVRVTQAGLVGGLVVRPKRARTRVGVWSDEPRSGGFPRPKRGPSRGVGAPAAGRLGARADVAQLVERRLPKPKVASSNLVVRLVVCAGRAAAVGDALTLCGDGLTHGAEVIVARRPLAPPPARRAIYRVLPRSPETGTMLGDLHTGGRFGSITLHPQARIRGRGRP